MRPHQHLRDHTSARRRRRTALLAFAGVSVAAAIAIGASVDAGTDTTATPASTGEINQMGMPVMETPGSASGTAEAGTVEVTGARWQLGTVPLDVAVRPHWVLRNTGTDAVTIGEPHPEVRAGCCPGAFTIDTTTIEPGGTAELSFELSMHAGMDGWHDIAVHVPLHSSTVGDHILELDVSGDFTNT